MSDIMDNNDFERLLAATDSGEDGRLARRYIARNVTALHEELEAVRSRNRAVLDVIQELQAELEQALNPRHEEGE